MWLTCLSIPISAPMYKELCSIHYIKKGLYIYLFLLKPRVRDKRLFGTLTSGLMLIPVTHPTHCVAECAKCWFSGQANTTWGPSTESVVHRPIQYGRPNYIRAYVRTKCTSQNSSRRLHVIGLLHTEIV